MGVERHLKLGMSGGECYECCQQWWKLHVVGSLSDNNGAVVISDVSNGNGKCVSNITGRWCYRKYFPSWCLK